MEGHILFLAVTVPGALIVATVGLFFLGYHLLVPEALITSLSAQYIAIAREIRHATFVNKQISSRDYKLYLNQPDFTAMFLERDNR
ncbi:hypothetical protein [Cobetia amphilecti]|uniref:Uncharacterized protein n=1 Tax=Cobetia amphilecti TaxID=1055104 RepID=A0AAP4TXW7_9GAMM|nr:hypothetical protein [Cobetia amphilecti]MDO6670996.1 hypothetical protein [Cobetia amphilecti]